MSSYHRGPWVVNTQQQLAWRVSLIGHVEYGEHFLAQDGTAMLWQDHAKSIEPRVKIHVLKAPEGYRFLDGTEDYEIGDRFFNVHRDDIEWMEVRNQITGPVQGRQAIYVREIATEPVYRPLTYAEFMMRYDPEEEGKRLVFRRQDDEDFVRYITGYDKDGVVLGGTYVDWVCLKELWEDDCGRKFQVAIED